MVGRVPSLMGDNLRQVLVSVTQRDGRKLTEAYQRLGFFCPARIWCVLPRRKMRCWTASGGAICWTWLAPIRRNWKNWARSSAICCLIFPSRFLRILSTWGGRLGIVSGLVAQLDQQINPWYYIEKYGEALVANREGQRFGLETAWQLVRPYLNTPAQVQRLLTLAENGRLRVQTDRETLRQYERIEKKIGQLGWSILGQRDAVGDAAVFEPEEEG
jgi:predicted unusual protein kinase regulating ubiquinone biosynthesis (AarF/ABC1/UbiB family)